MAIAQEQIDEWLDHPMTKLYKKILQAYAHQYSDVRQLNVEDSSIQEIGTTVFAMANYMQGIEDCLQFRDVFDRAREAS